MISACIIAWNAEQHIISCLDSIKDYCSEINIALDTKTTDRTGTVIAAWGDTHNHISVNVYPFEWVRDSFADARNFIGAKATKPWSFVIDADERATNHVQPLDGYDAYTVKVVGTINGKINTIFPSPRLYKTNIGVTFRRSTHEDNWESLVGKTVVDCDMMLESVEKTEEALLKAIPQRWHMHAHHWLILLGRYVCKARKPECYACPISDLCNYENKTKK